jgi:hypothetical protein
MYRRDDVEMTTKPKLNLIIESALETQENEISCQECFDLLDEYTDLIVEGAAPCQVMNVVKQHLKICPDCMKLFECVLTIIGSDDEPWPCDPSPPL